ncbi:hypothetical protein [Listeria cornellensis]|uniref:Uncharacterized protein n=1 Tax=Listeria cornellensis FSL F6-0969 TaxID=1265820 RepID=W7BQ54_9LIST|nr:hypothetical protein [Listeria cornellensis]EUJ25271.1 hypothetical protein PCORN_17979 [Listeria cornellensis FSL F6-0969]
MALEINIINKSLNKLTQKAFIYVEGQQNTLDMKRLKSDETDQIKIPTTTTDLAKNIMLSYLNTDSAIINTKIGQVTSLTQTMQLDIIEITPQGTIRYKIQ